ncbi:hypothetical protein RFI_01554 [Reticulomyxa filosa]|uniref:Uncharacterized protein n=1 Tax=Reticulomyxa filosa TaxID=46433 RepID=X6PAF3_RETFI|nr:hypothetical protein RFI_01554 [Reticulomyxa filosa]|eukprot:ETO35510.1 hypothetical protein RFI_01554 [Reticulomyxa filosa]
MFGPSNNKKQETSRVSSKGGIFSEYLQSNLIKFVVLLVHCQITLKESTIIFVLLADIVGTTDETQAKKTMINLGTFDTILVWTVFFLKTEKKKNLTFWQFWNGFKRKQTLKSLPKDVNIRVFRNIVKETTNPKQWCGETWSAKLLSETDNQMTDAIIKICVQFASEQLSRMMNGVTFTRRANGDVTVYGVEIWLEKGLSETVSRLSDNLKKFCVDNKPEIRYRVKQFESYEKAAGVQKMPKDLLIADLQSLFATQQNPGAPGKSSRRKKKSKNKKNKSENEEKESEEGRSNNLNNQFGSISPLNRSESAKSSPGHLSSGVSHLQSSALPKLGLSVEKGDHSHSVDAWTTHTRMRAHTVGVTTKVDQALRSEVGRHFANFQGYETTFVDKLDEKWQQILAAEGCPVCLRNEPLCQVDEISKKGLQTMILCLCTSRMDIILCDYVFVVVKHDIANDDIQTTKVTKTDDGITKTIKERGQNSSETDTSDTNGITIGDDEGITEDISGVLKESWVIIKCKLLSCQHVMHLSCAPNVPNVILKSFHCSSFFRIFKHQFFYFLLACSSSRLLFSHRTLNSRYEDDFTVSPMDPLIRHIAIRFRVNHLLSDTSGEAILNLTNVPTRVYRKLVQLFSILFLLFFFKSKANSNKEYAVVSLNDEKKELYIPIRRGRIMCDVEIPHHTVNENENMIDSESTNNVNVVNPIIKTHDSNFEIPLSTHDSKSLTEQSLPKHTLVLAENEDDVLTVIVGEVIVRKQIRLQLLSLRYIFTPEKVNGSVHETNLVVNAKIQFWKIIPTT